MPSPPDALGGLAALQRAFASVLLGGPSAAAPLLGQLTGEPASKLRRLAAYHRNVVGNRIAALRSSYPRVAASIGDDATPFDELARSFAIANDSQSGDLNEYGAAFADWLQTAAASRPWLAELARLEWDVQAAWYAADCAPFDFAALADVAPEVHGELRFRLAPAFRARISPWTIAALWQGSEATAAVAAEQYLWVVRPRELVSVETPGAGQFALVAALGAGATLNEAIAAGFLADPELDVTETLAHAARWGIIAAFTLPGEVQ